MNYKLIGSIGVLGIAAGIIGFSFIGKKQKVNSIKRQTLIRVLEQLKHQVFMICMKGAPQFSKQSMKLKKERRADDQIKELLEQKAINIYQKKERLILMKHGISKQQLEKALEKDFAKDKEISQYKQDIQVMLEHVTKGKTPVLSVPSQLKNALKPSAALQLIKNLKIAQLIVLLSQFQKAAKQNPNFVVGDNQQTTNIIRKIDLYNIKVTYLQQHGPKVQSMNHYNFIQIIELYSFESPQFKTKVDKIEHLYGIYSDMMGFEVDFEKMKQQFDKALNETTQIKKESLIEIKTLEQIKKQAQTINNIQKQDSLDVKQNQLEKSENNEEKVENVPEIKQNEQVIDTQIQQPITTPQSEVVVQQTTQEVTQTIPKEKTIDEPVKIDSKEIENQQNVEQHESLTVQKDETNLEANQQKIQEAQK